MWFFMNSCYLLSAISAFLLFLGFFQSIFHFMILNANLLTLTVLISLVYLFTETLVIFFYVGTGVSIKEYVQEHRLDQTFHRESIQIKRKLYPPLLTNMLLMIILFVLVGAVDNRMLPAWIYSIYYSACLLHYGKIKLIQHACFRENTELILKMSGVKRL